MTVSEAARAGLGDREVEARGREVADKIWKTAGSRFNGARRLQTRHVLSSWATSLLAAYVVFIQLIGLVQTSGEQMISPAAVTVGTAFLAVVILVMTILETSRNYQLRADHLHASGMELTALNDRLRNQIIRLKGDQDGLAREIDAVTELYHEAIARTRENHDPGDFELFKAQSREEFRLGPIAAGRIRVQEKLRIGLWYYLAIFGTPAVALLFW